MPKAAPESAQRKRAKKQVRKPKAARAPRAAAKVNATTGAFLVSAALWEKLAPLLPVAENPHRFGGGRPRTPDRRCANAIFFVLRTGCQWSALSATGLCAPSTAHARCQQWRQAGVFERFWQAGLLAYDELRGLDWEWLAMDGAMTKAPLGGGEGKNPGPNPTDRGKQGAKRSLLTEAAGIPVGLAIAGANRHDMKLVGATLEGSPLARPAPTPERPQHLCLDKGYDYDEVRASVAQFGFTAHIRARGEEAQALRKEAGLRARRWVVERTHAWFNRFRRLLARWEKKPQNYLGLLPFVCGLLCFRAAGLFG